MYVFNLLETYVAGLSLLSTVFFEAIAVSWLYGREMISAYHIFGLNAFAMNNNQISVSWLYGREMISSFLV